ncbi:MAG: Mn2+/Fe2+ NRAMP family transporter [Bacteroidia bacterium]|jgi:Mn2+/Fe2+ NRAMP family transporter
MLSKLKSLGPGLLYAGAAIGVSHIVQSTKAGASFGFVLLIGIVLAHILKYPFFSLGSQYQMHTGKNLLHGYQKLGKGALILVLLLTISTVFLIQAAVTAVTAGLANKLFGFQLSPWAMSAIILTICVGIISIRRFSILEHLMKIIMIVLAVTTCIAVASSFYADVPRFTEHKAIFDFMDTKHAIFLIAFLGWMPAPLDLSIWHSIWSEEASNSNKKGGKNSSFDFKVGYWGTAILAACFLILGANIIYGTGTELSPKGGVYAGQLIDLFTSSLGEWAYFVIAIAAFTTMFSTTLTCLDAMPKVLVQTLKYLRKCNIEEAETFDKKGKLQLLLTSIIAFGTVLVLAFLIQNMGHIVFLATTISFLTAPILAALGIILVTKHLPKGFWSKYTLIIAYLGLFALIVLSLYYIKLEVI